VFGVEVWFVCTAWQVAHVPALMAWLEPGLFSFAASPIARAHQNRSMGVFYVVAFGCNAMASRQHTVQVVQR